MAAPAVIPKVLSIGQATAAGATVYTTPVATTAARITSLLVTNLDTIAHTITIRTSVGTMTADDAHCLYKDFPVDSGDTISFNDPRVLGYPVSGSQGRLHIQADADSVLNVAVYGAELDATHPDIGRSIPFQFFQAQLTTVSTTMFGSAAGNVGVVMSLTLCNTSGVDHTVDVIQITPTSFTLHQALPVPANSTVVLTDAIIVGDGSGIQVLNALADVAGWVTATLCVVVVDET